ncbi:metallophosphoesterase family protein [Methylocapsa acidiphila]|uniref:metallophosphoesterase family protein n=1 Tax=Methylocapsa acidiphila TaxID=133552 RepID=UPI000686A10D|nr:metallophosphoesterase [Methylocapsa acidiphila]
MVFHIAGDTGGVRDPAPQQIVSAAMEDDAERNQSGGEVAFLYHLGDVVYYNGATSEYYPQFYLPYEFCPAPILSIPGNHDGDPMLAPETRQPLEPSLSAWRRNFCSETRVITPEAGEAPRQAMIQPNPYWTLQTPKANFIGLYTSVPEGGVVREDQKEWLIGELKHAARETGKALFVCLHHPVFSADSHYSGSVAMKSLLDEAVQASGAHPDIVFSAHVHNYQRFTRVIDDQQYTYIVAGAGGYWHLHSMAKFMGAKVTAPFRQIDDPSVVLENYVDDTHGFMRVEIEGDMITARYYAVRRPQDSPGTPARVADLFQLQFKSNKLIR